jgi:outer membrane protein OmpA-like peptidoglycan-associated protein
MSADRNDRSSPPSGALVGLEDFFMLRRVALVSCLLGGLACASPSVAPLGAGPITPGPGERVAVTHNYLIVDSSESVTEVFPTERALVESFIAAQPEGTYEQGGTAFGGYQRQTETLSTFNRAAAKQYASDLEHLSEGTPIDRVFGEVGQDLAGKSGQASVVVFSDGRPTDPVGREVAEQKVLDAAGRLAEGFTGQVCIHTVHVGDDPAGAEFLRRLSTRTGCGSARSMGSVMNTAALQNFEREVFLGAVPAVAAAPRDSDGDGVLDDVDQCPGTPTGVKVDKRGCWVIQGLRFAFDSSKIEPQYYAELDQVATQLKGAPDVQIRVDGHTDSVGTAEYNQALSERRAQSVSDYLSARGVARARMGIRGYGESQPIASNETEEGKAENRRVEIKVVPITQPGQPGY